MALQKSGQAVSDTLKSWRDKNLTTIPGTGTGIEGHCLAVQTHAWQVPAGQYQPSALAAWEATPKKYRHTDPAKAPIGAVHFWVNHNGKGYGHIATQADVVGHSWSSDTPRTGHIGLQATAYFSSPHGWNMHYLGWANWLEGYVLPVKALPKKKPVGPVNS